VVSDNLKRQTDRTKKVFKNPFSEASRTGWNQLIGYLYGGRPLGCDCVANLDKAAAVYSSATNHCAVDVVAAASGYHTAHVQVKLAAHMKCSGTQ
jgi:hypothetical protein